jgi:uncharacterized protein (TIGR00251 family)
MLIKVRVIPKARQNKIIEEGGSFKVYLTAPPVEGKANQALLQLLAEHYNVKKNKVKIISGEKSRNKIIEISI